MGSPIDWRAGRDNDLSDTDRHDVRLLAPQDIIVSNRFRKNMDEAIISGLMESIERVGLRTPPSVRLVISPDPAIGTTWHLVTGWHRLEAWKRLGLSDIPIELFAGDEHAAHHRAEQTALERGMSTSPNGSG